MEAAIPHNWNNLLEHEGEEKAAAGGQEDIVGLEEDCELSWLLVLHVGLDAEDDDEVRDEGRPDLVGRREERLALDIVCPVVGDPEGREVEAGDEEIREGGHGGRGRRRGKRATLD